MFLIYPVEQLKTQTYIDYKIWDSLAASRQGFSHILLFLPNFHNYRVYLDTQLLREMRDTMNALQTTANLLTFQTHQHGQHMDIHSISILT